MAIKTPPIDLETGRQAVGVFIDWENTRHQIRRAHAASWNDRVARRLTSREVNERDHSLPPWFGYLRPNAFSRWLVERRQISSRLDWVGIYLGEPDHRIDPIKAKVTANLKRAWRKDFEGMERWKSVTPPIKYRETEGGGHAEEKGVDVAFAVDAVAYTVQHRLDVVVLVTADQDYQPLIYRLRHLDHPVVVEQVKWFGAMTVLSGRDELFTHFVAEADYRRFADLTDHCTEQPMNWPECDEPGTSLSAEIRSIGGHDQRIGALGGQRLQDQLHARARLLPLKPAS